MALRTQAALPATIFQLSTPDTDLLPVLYQDDHYIAINKPPGLLVHRSGIDAKETRFAIQLLRDQIGRRVSPVHRLDKPTSGVLLFAYDEAPLAKMKRLFEECQVSKRYQAITRGFAPNEGTIDHPLRKLLDHGPKRKSDEAQEALTQFKTLSKTEHPFPSGKYETTRYSHVELFPKTGRRHQLRRHMNHINCPIIGDTKHGDIRQNHAFHERFGFCRMFLHATQLTFEQPITGEPIRIDAPLWPDFQQALVATKLVKGGIASTL
ncbi:MAG: tRNA pseudouridine65 synthase [Candidatus Pelagisphaera sp.]|jgi:tRNA pseudouridine65 synthase